MIDASPSRRPGWRKLFGENASYNNQDLHDQLCGDPAGNPNLQEYYEDRTPPHENADSSVDQYPPSGEFCGTTKKTRSTGRQPVTFLYEAISTSGQRRLLSGTQSRLYSLDEVKGNWRILADSFGGIPKAGLPERRLYAAQVNDTVILTNNFSQPFVWYFDQPTMGCGMQATDPIDTLTDIGLTKAGAVAAWKGVVFLGDVEMDGERIEHRIVWSDLNNPQSWVPSNDSIAGYQDLAYGERILAMKPLADYLIIYTTKSIWKVAAVGGDAVFSFRQEYSDPVAGALCLAYRNTLVSTGDTHFYMGRDGIYAWNLYRSKPEQVEWIHRATSVIYDSIDDQKCEAHVGHYDPRTEEYWISWVEKGDTFPSRTLAINLEYTSADVIDHGFTAFVNYTADTRGSVRDFLLERCICTDAELNSAEITAIMPPPVKEGGFSQAVPVSECQSVNPDMPIYTNAFIEVDGRLIEDPDAAQASSNSLCALLGDLMLEDLCQECNADQLFVMASAEDWCLKHYGGVYYREKCTAFTVCGTYSKIGYDSILRTGPMDFRVPDNEKNIRRIELDYDSEPQTVPTTVKARLGYSAQPVDPNADNRCALVWKDLKPKELVCASQRSGPDHSSMGTRPNRTMNWPIWYSGRYLYLEITISGQGGVSSFSRIGYEVRVMPRNAYS